MFGGSNTGNSFTFGSNTPAANNGGGFSFGGNNNASQGPTSTNGFSLGASGASTGGGLFGAKPAGTGAPAFGQSAAAAPKPGGFSFGQTSNTTPGAPAASSGFSFGGASKPNTGGGLFGAAQPATTNNSGGFSFGGANNANSTNNTAPSGGLFGGNKPAGTSLFGGNGNTNTGNTSGGLFGGSNTSGGLFNSNNSSGNTSGGLFGGNNTTSGTSGGLFGSNNNNNSTATSGGLFGANNNASKGLFGSNQANSGGLFGGSGGLFSNNNTANNANSFALGGSQQQQPRLTAMTKVSDLPEAFQKELEQLNEYIQTQVAIAEQLKNDEEEHKELIDSIPRDINFLEKRYISTNQALNSDLKFVESFKAKTLENFNDWVEKLIKVYLQLTNPMLVNSNSTTDQSGSGASGIKVIGVNGTRFTDPSSQAQQSKQLQQQQLEKDSHLNVPQILNSYFVSKIEEFKDNIEKYQLILQEVENSINDLHKVSVSGGLSLSGNYGLEMIVSTLQEEFKLYVELANEYAEIHHHVKGLEELGGY